MTTPKHPTNHLPLPHKAGTSSRWTSKTASDSARAARLEKMSFHAGFRDSPFLPRSKLDMLTHEAEFAADTTAERLATLQNVLVDKESRQRTGVGLAIPRGVWTTIVGETSTLEIWAPRAEKNPGADWPSASELKFYGDARANGGVRLSRMLPPPRCNVVTESQALAMHRAGMGLEIALLLVGKRVVAFSELRELAWEKRPLLGDLEELVKRTAGELELEQLRFEGGDGKAGKAEEFDEGWLRDRREGFGELMDAIRGRKEKEKEREEKEREEKEKGKEI